MYFLVVHTRENLYVYVCMYVRDEFFQEPDKKFFSIKRVCISDAMKIDP